MNRSVLLLTILAVLNIVSVVLGNNIPLPPALRDFAWPLQLSIDLASVALIVITQTQLIHSKNAFYWASVIVIVGSLLSFIVWAWQTAKPATNYFILDATDNMLPYFNDIHTQVTDIASTNASYKQGVGLRIYGGRIYDSNNNSNNSQNCAGNTQLLVDPGYYVDAKTVINHRSDESHPGLDDVQAAGEGSLIVAIRLALDKDIVNYDKPVTLIIITSAAYSECSPPPPRYIPDTVKAFDDLGTNIDLKMLIISIGKPTSQTFDLFNSYANDFNGCYINMLTPSDLSSVIQANSSYCSNYPASKPVSTLTP